MTNALHEAMSAFGLLAGMGGVNLISRQLDRDRRWSQHRFATPATVLSSLGSATLFFAVVDTSWVWLAQRQFVGVLTGWVAYHAYRLYRIDT